MLTPSKWALRMSFTSTELSLRRLSTGGATRSLGLGGPGVKSDSDTQMFFADMAGFPCFICVMPMGCPRRKSSSTSIRPYCAIFPSNGSARVPMFSSSSPRITPEVPELPQPVHRGRGDTPLSYHGVLYLICLYSPCRPHYFLFVCAGGAE